MRNVLDLISHKHLKVLLVEDSDVIALLAGRALDLVAVDVQRVCDGVAAVEAAKATAFDVILMDVQMPLLSGLEATAQIRSFETLIGRPRVKILGVSATAGLQDCLESGMDGWYSKPACYRSIINQLRY